jgi:hypothetical protein
MACSWERSFRRTSKRQNRPHASSPSIVKRTPTLPRNQTGRRAARGPSRCSYVPEGEVGALRGDEVLIGKPGDPIFKPRN